MPAPAALFRRLTCLTLRLALGGALLSGFTGPTVRAQSQGLRPDSVTAPAPADTLRPATSAPTAAELPPDAEPTPAPVSRTARWTIIGACALLTLSTLLLYNVRSR